MSVSGSILAATSTTPLAAGSLPGLPAGRPMAWVLFGLLVAATGISLASLLLAVRHQAALRQLAETWRERGPVVTLAPSPSALAGVQNAGSTEATRLPPAEERAPTGPSEGGRSAAASVTAAKAPLGAPAAAVGPTVSPAVRLDRSAPPPTHRTDGDGQGAGSPASMEGTHQEVARLLAGLCQEAPRLADLFQEPALREAFRGEFGAPLAARVERLRIAASQGEAPLREHWLGEDLVVTLDALSRFYSEAAAEGHRGHAPGVALTARLRALLYESFNAACRREGWFAIDAVEPYRTSFDPRQHEAVAGSDAPGASGLVVGVKAAGLRDVRSGSIQRRAKVVVGR